MDLLRRKETRGGDGEQLELRRRPRKPKRTADRAMTEEPMKDDSGDVLNLQLSVRLCCALSLNTDQHSTTAVRGCREAGLGEEGG